MAWLPNYNDKLDPGAVSAAYHFQPHDIPSYLAHNRYGSNAEQWDNAVRQIAPEVKDYIQRKQSDEIANTLLQQSGAPAQLQGKGAAAFQAWQKYQGDQPDPIEEELLWKKLHPEQYPDYGQGKSGAAMTPYQQGHLDLMRQREQRLGAGGPSTGGHSMTSGQMDTALPNGEIHASADGSDITWDRPGKPSMRVNPKSILPYVSLPQPIAKPAPTPSHGVLQSDANAGTDAQPSQAQPKQNTAMPSPKTKSDYDALPSGTRYMHPDGSIRVKK